MITLCITRFSNILYCNERSCGARKLVLGSGSDIIWSLLCCHVSICIYILLSKALVVLMLHHMWSK